MNGSITQGVGVKKLRIPVSLLVYIYTTAVWRNKRNLLRLPSTLQIKINKYDSRAWLEASSRRGRLRSTTTTTKEVAISLFSRSCLGSHCLYRGRYREEDCRRFQWRCLAGTYKQVGNLEKKRKIIWWTDFPEATVNSNCQISPTNRSTLIFGYTPRNRGIDVYKINDLSWPKSQVQRGYFGSARHYTLASSRSWPRGV